MVCQKSAPGADGALPAPQATAPLLSASQPCHGPFCQALWVLLQWNLGCNWCNHKRRTGTHDLERKCSNRDGQCTEHKGVCSAATNVEQAREAGQAADLHGTQQGASGQHACSAWLTATAVCSCCSSCLLRRCHVRRGRWATAPLPPSASRDRVPSLLLPLSTCCQYLHRVKKVCLSRTLMNKSPAGQGRMTTRRQRCGRHVAHVALTKSFNVPPPQLRGSRCRVHVNSPRLRIAKTALSGHHHAHAHLPPRSLRLPIRCPIGSASPCNQRQAPGGR